ncbi:helix-turn-helix domain-containing protein [Paenibacillus glycinis]|uniref:Helix-turn-helix domain-containing protein n=1 Tax=Paenibacillus glycinis TaxID=2697035 RepID=A0ABW9XMY5_9BACL|nr:helix-turn-helix domain-containing protein [Paenibacillus glycinis]NBD23774.1 helix-turn-helix domain-containing protein [Paenibacillus glycinis]
MMVDLFAYSPDAVTVVRTYQGKRFIYACNTAFYTMTGYTGNQLIGLELSSLPLDGNHPLWPIVDRLCASIALGNSDAFAESRVTLPKHSQLFGELHAKKMKASREAFILITIRDRSEHKWIEEMTYERDPIVSMLLTTAGTVTSMRSYRGPLSYDVLELSRMDSDQFVALPDRARVRNGLRRLLFSKESGEFKFTLQLFQDQFHVHSIVKPFYSGDGSFRCFAILVLSMEAVPGTETAEASAPPALPEDSGKAADVVADSSYKLRLLMLEKRVSVTQLAENTQISLTTISNIRNGKIKKPQRLTAQLIADELGVAPSDIWSSYK